MHLQRTIALGIFAATALSAAVEPAQLDAARALLDAKKLAEAQAAFEKLVAADPAHAGVNYYLGDLAYRRDDMDQAVAYLEKAIAAAPTNSNFHRRLGDAYGRTAQKASIFKGLSWGKKCLAMYQKAVELDPKNVDARASLFDFYSQAPGFAGGSREKALEQAAAIKQLNPSRGRLTFATLYASEKKYDAALAEFDEVLKTNPNDYVALYQVGRLASLTGQFIDRGLASLRRCLELPVPDIPNTPGHAAAQWRIGTLLEKKKDAAGARAAYEAALKIDPKFASAEEALRKLK
jgi:tetratricopeptide (TPR) repeat protein